MSEEIKFKMEKVKVKNVTMVIKEDWNNEVLQKITVRREIYPSHFPLFHGNPTFVVLETVLYDETKDNVDKNENPVPCSSNLYKEQK